MIYQTGRTGRGDFDFVAIPSIPWIPTIPIPTIPWITAIARLFLEEFFSDSVIVYLHFWNHIAGHVAFDAPGLTPIEAIGVLLSMDLK